MHHVRQQSFSSDTDLARAVLADSSFKSKAGYFPAINHSLLRSYNVTGAPLSHIVENDVTVSALTEVIRHCSNVEVKYNTKVKRWVQLVTSLNIIFIIQDISF